MVGLTGTTSARVELLEDRTLLSWNPIGPFSATDGQVENISPNDQIVGALHTVIAHPTNADILYAGGTNGGLWKTTNATAASPNWIPLSDSLPSQSIGALTFDVGDATSNTVYAGIGRYSSFGRIGNNRIGLLRTTDDGATLNVVDGSGTLVGKNISGIHANGNTIVVSVNTADSFGSSSTGIFRSTNGGATFAQISVGNGSSTGLPGGVSYDLVADPTDPNVLYTSIVFADPGGQNGIYKSVDQGASWTKVSSAAIDALIGNGTSNLEMAVGTSNNVYVSVINFGQVDGLFRSGNGGTTWVQMDTPSTNENGTDVGLNPGGGKGPGPGSTPEEIAGGQGAIHFSMVADPNDANIVYVGGDRQPLEFQSPTSVGATDFSGRLFRGDASKAAGTQFVHLTHSNTLGPAGGGTASSSSPHADSREMVFDANGNIIEVDDGGIYRRTNPQSDTGDWFGIIGDLQVTEAHDVAWDAVSNVGATGNQDTGTTYQPAEGANTWDSLSTADGGDVAIDDITLAASGQSIRYTSFQNLGAFRRTTWDASGNLIGTAFPALTVSSGSPFVGAFRTPVELNNIDPQRLVIQGGNSTYESLNQGNTIAQVGSGVFNGSITQNAIEYGGNKSGVPNLDVLWVGSGSDVYFRSTAGPLAPTSSDPTTGTIRDLAIDSDDWATAFIIDSNQVFTTTNEGVSWTDITGNLLTMASDLRSIRFVAGPNIDAIVVGTNQGVFASSTTDPGVWVPLGADLPNVLVYDMEYDIADDVLVAGTLGRGAWKFDNVVSMLDAALDLTPATIIDDGEAGFSTVGGFVAVSNANARDGDVRNVAQGSGASVASWQFDGLAPGRYQVAATWVAHPNRATNAPYTILDSVGGNQLNRVLVNQELAPDDFNDDGTEWENLAIVTVTGSTLVVELSNAANEFVIADAIRIRPTMSPETPAGLIIDDGDSRFSKTSGWNVSHLSNGYLVDVTNAPAGNGSRVATWAFDGLTPGNYVVAATWTTNQNRATNAPYSIRDGVGGDLLEKILVNQELAPDDFLDVGANWENLALVTITGSTLVVELSNDANQFVIADAIRLQPTLDPPPPQGVIVDDGDPEFSTTAGWNQSVFSNGFQGDVRNSPSGDGSEVASWTFNGLAPGEYTIAATWTAHPNRATDSPFTAFHGVGGPVLGTVDLNQEQAPDGFTTLGSSWESLMTVLVTDGTLVVELTDDADGYVIADAIRVVPANPSPADPIVIDGSFADWEIVPTFTDPVDDEHDTDHDQPGDTPALVDHPDVDLLSYKVTHDAENFYFLFESRGVIGRTQVEDLANGLRAGRYYVIMTIDVDTDDSTGYGLYEGGYYTGTTDTTGYDVNSEIEFFSGAFNTDHSINHGARNSIELQQAFADQSKGQYLWNGPKTQGPFMPGFVEILPGSYDFLTQWVYKENDPALGGNDSVTFVQDKGPVVDGIMNYALSADGHMLEMKVPFKGFLNDENGNPIIQIGQFVDLSFSLEASGELGNDVSVENPDGLWGSDTAEPINNYFLRPVS